MGRKVAKQTKTDNYTLPTKPELEDAYAALWATLKNKLGPYLSDYAQLIEKGSPLNNQYQQLKSNISQHIPSNADFRSPQRMSEWAQAAALNAPMGLAINTNKLSSLLDDWSNRGIKAEAYPNKSGDIVELSKLIIPKDKRGTGLGSEFMSQLTNLADEGGAKITLDASTDYGASSLNRLKNFYKKSGFVENKGKNKDFEISRGMYRNPIKKGSIESLPPTPFSKAHDVAQKNAALPIEQGGLGLPPNNTAMDRARAMGFDTPTYHGTSYPGFDEFNTNGADYTKTEGTGAFFTNNPELAGSYTSMDYPGANPAILPVLLNKGKGRNINFNGNNWSDLKGKTTDDYARAARDSGKYDSLTMRNVNDAGPSGYDIEADTIAMFEPSKIRSKFAAFDPMKKDSANILASILAGTTLAGLYQKNESETSLDSIRRKLNK